MTKHTPDFSYLRGLSKGVPHSDLDRMLKRHEDGYCLTWSEEHYALEHAKNERARIAELEAHQEFQMREEGALRDTIDGLKEELAAEREKVERLRFDLKDISGSIEYADATGQYEYTLRMCAGKADEALAATEPRDLTKPRNYGSIEVEGAKSD